MKKKELKAQLTEAHLRHRTFVRAVRKEYNNFVQIKHYDSFKDSDTCSGCRIVVKQLRELLKPYDMEFMVEDHYLPALKEEIKKCNDFFFPEHQKHSITFTVEPYDWGVSEGKDQTPKT